MNGNVFKRINLQQICAFILYSEENPQTENLTYKERLNKGVSSIYKRLEQLCKDEDEFNDAVSDLYEALTIYEEVFTEIGMKSGARIVVQLLHTDDYVETGKKIN